MEKLAAQKKLCAACIEHDKMVAVQLRTSRHGCDAWPGGLACFVLDCAVSAFTAGPSRLVGLELLFPIHYEKCN